MLFGILPADENNISLFSQNGGTVLLLWKLNFVKHLCILNPIVC